VVASIPTEHPISHMLALAPRGDRVFTANIGDGTVTSIDLRARRPLGAFPVAKQVEGIGVAPDGRHLWVGSNGDSIAVVVDADAGRAVDTLKGFGMPYRLAVSPDGRWAVISDPPRAQVRIVDAASRKLVHLVAVPASGTLATAEFPGSPSPEGLAISSDSRFAYVTLQGRNEVAGIDLATGKITGYHPVGTGPDGIAYARPIE
jgi:DNA-binding beta-propeller fold protein YncE